MRRFAMIALALSLSLTARLVSAAVDFVMDPSPAFSGKLVLADSAESESGANERYTFTGGASNGASFSQRLLVRARGNGVAIAASERSFALAPGSSININYDFTSSSHPSTVGLEFEAPDRTISSVHGVFHAAPVSVAAAPAPAGQPLTLVLLAGALLLIGSRLGSMRRSAGLYR
jgi:hypothetical protein